MKIKKKDKDVLEETVSVAVARKLSDGDYGNNSVMLSHTKKYGRKLSKEEYDKEYDNMFDSLSTKVDKMADQF